MMIILTSNPALISASAFGVYCLCLFHLITTL